MIVLDTETGGLNADVQSILSVGCVVLNDNLSIIDEFENYIKEDNIVAEPRALAINKIDLEWLKVNGKPPAEVLTNLEEFLSKYYSKKEKITMVGHNVGFDVGFMKRLYKQGGAEGGYESRFSHRTMDTAGIIRFLMLAKRLDIPAANSTDAFKHFGIEISETERHTALADARATAKLLKHLVNMVKAPSNAYHEVDAYYKDETTTPQS